MWHLNRYGKTLLEREYDMTFNRQSHHAAKLRSTCRRGLSRGARRSTRWTAVGVRVPRARLFGSAKIASNPSKYGAKCDSRLIDGDGCEVKTTNLHLTLRGKIWYNIRHTLGEGLENGVFRSAEGYDQICETTN